MSTLEDKTMDVTEGVHIRAIARYEDGDKSIGMLSMDVWPIPSEVLIELSQVMEQAAYAFLKSKHVISDKDPHDLFTVPPGGQVQ